MDEKCIETSSDSERLEIWKFLFYFNRSVLEFSYSKNLKIIKQNDLL